MISSVSGAGNLILQHAKSASMHDAPKSKLKLDLNSIPDNKMKIQSDLTTEPGKGLKLDIKV